MLNFPSFFNAQAGGYEIEQSLRFNSADSAYLNRTPGSAGNRRTWTWSGWVKRSALATSQSLFSGYSGTTDADFTHIRFSNNTGVVDSITVEGWNTKYRVTSAFYRDPSAWYHIVLAFDTTQASADDRIKLYVNGVQITQFSTNNAITQNHEGGINKASNHYIGTYNGTGDRFNGYLAEVNFIDGSALDHEDFGEFDDNGVWRPIKYAGSYTGNSFYLKFASGDGTDSSGLSNTWTANNFTTSGTGTDVMSDTPTTNWCTLNPILGRASDNASLTYRNGNLEAGNNTSTTYNAITFGTFGVSSGKWYFEVTVGTALVGPGISTTTATSPLGTGSYQYYGNGNKVIDGVASSYGGALAANDVVGVAFDLDAGTLVFYKNNVSLGTAATGLSGTFVPSLSHADNNSTYQVFNFGQRAFAYTPPTGYKALNTANLPAPTVKDGSDNFNTVLYTGNNSTQTISTNFSPDFVWAKNRDTSGYHHDLYDRVRGDNLRIFSSQTGAETTGYLQFGTNSFSLTSGGGINANGDAHVAWHWLAGGSGSSNTDGTVTSTVSANPSAGFSIVSYTGTGANATVGHGLGVAPTFLAIKNRDTNSSWMNGHQGLGSWSDVIFFDLTSAKVTDSTVFNGTAPTSTVFSVGTNFQSNKLNDDMIAYCFAEVEGYSKFGSYTGNGSTDGVFVYCGFSPRWILWKETTVGESWFIHDTARTPYNVSTQMLRPNYSNSEATGDSVDILSNGFKFRSGGAGANYSGRVYIFAAFAENPFGGSGVSPATAR